MHFLIVIAVLGALIIAENCSGQPVGHGGYRLLASAVLMALPPAFAALASRWMIGVCGEAETPRAALVQRMKKVRSVHATLWLAVVAVVILPLGWPRLVRFNWGLDQAFVLDELLFLVPVLVPLVVSWAALYDGDRAFRARLSDNDLPSAATATRAAYVLVYSRHFLGVLLAPVVGLLAIQDAARLLAPEWTEGFWAFIVQGPAIVLVAVFFPSLLRHVWDTRPLEPGPLRERLEELARRTGFRAREILVWQTDGMIVNAAVTGVVPGLRYVFLTDGLLARLSEEEITAVFGHEIGHLRHRHLLLRVAAMLAPLSLWVLFGEIIPEATSVDSRQILAASALAWAAPVGLAMLVAIVSYLLLVFGPFCRLLEGQADLFACQSLVPDSPAPAVETFVAALENLASACGIDREAKSWQHDSIARRVEFLQEVAEDPACEARFQHRVHLLSGVVVAGVLVPLAYQAILRI